MTLVLQKLRDNPDIDSDNIDDNWEAIEDAVNTLQEAVELGAVTITSASTTDDGLSFRLSNGTVLGPLPFSGTPMRIMGDWLTGTSYRRGDIVKYTNGALIVSIDHVVDDLEDDLAASKISILVENGTDGKGGGSVGNVQSFCVPGALANGNKALGLYLCHEDCRLVAEIPVVAGLVTPVSTGSPLTITVKKIPASGGLNTSYGNIALAAGVRRASIAVNVDLVAGDILCFQQATETGLVGGSDITITAVLQPPAA